VGGRGGDYYIVEEHPLVILVTAVVMLALLAWLLDFQGWRSKRRR
jgi:hypothetical protein